MSIRQPPTPPPSPPPSLPSQINAATTKQHTLLNRLIVDRLPLALPPQAHDPRLFGYGLAAFAQIYFEFETAWNAISRVGEADFASKDNSHGAQVRQWLATLRPAGLDRTQRLAKDVSHISDWTGHQVDLQLGAQRKMLRKMHASIRGRPHIVIAYAWVMYMAIFSGGRWIRQQLGSAGAEFWVDETEALELESVDASSPEHMPGISFLSFPGDRDGEDIKAEFKRRLADMETLLTDQERQEIVDAAAGLFQDCIDLVGMLDSAVRVEMARQKYGGFLLYGIALVVLVLLLLWNAPR